jgi:phage gpG-like protein
LAEVVGDEVEIGSNLIYAATHQMGDEERNIPARAYLGLSDDDESELQEVIDDFISRAME